MRKNIFEEKVGKENFGKIFRGKSKKKKKKKNRENFFLGKNREKLIKNKIS